MALQEGLIRALVVPDDFSFINGRIITIYPQSFEISIDGGSTYNEMDSFGTVQGMVNCNNAGSTVGYLKLLVLPEVSSFSFQLANDTAVPKTTFTFNTKNCISLPDISISRVKSVIGSGANNIIGLLTSPNLNPASPRIPKSDIYIPTIISINNLPDYVGNSDLISPHSLGELAGYCHTAAAGFYTSWGGDVIPYNSISEFDISVTKQQIPVAGDLNNNKWDNIKIVYPDNKSYLNLNFNHIFTHISGYKYANNNEDAEDVTTQRSVKIYYNNGTTDILMQTITKDIVLKGRHFTTTLIITSSSALQKRVNWSLTITNNRTTTLTFNNGLKAQIFGSSASLINVGSGGTININPGESKNWTGICYYHVDDFNPQLVAGDEIELDIYRWSSIYNSYTQSWEWDFRPWIGEVTNLGS